jgi:putative tryptophan/tyrosine transport system substrate-binding protein
MSEDGACAARFLCALLATVVKPISDLRLLISGLCALLFGLCVPVAAQQPAKVPRIAWLTGGNMPPDRMEAFRLGLRELGYIEGKNITIEWRSAQGQRDRVTALAEELVRLKVDVILTGSTSDTRGTKAATTTIPIVMTNDGDPVGNGFVASLAQPGGNITGLSTLSPELSTKRLELLKEIVPKLARVAVFGTSTSASNAQELKEVEGAAGVLGVKLQYFDVLTLKDIETAFRAAGKGRADAVLWLVSGGIVTATQAQAAMRNSKNLLPTIYSSQSHVEAGGLMSYGVNSVDLARRAAYFVDKILKGAKPAEIPVEQPTKFEFAINLKTAKQIGLSIPQWTLVKADKVIK